MEALLLPSWLTGLLAARAASAFDVEYCLLRFAGGLGVLQFERAGTNGDEADGRFALIVELNRVNAEWSHLNAVNDDLVHPDIAEELGPGNGEVL